MPVEQRPLDLYAGAGGGGAMSARKKGRVDLDATREQLEQVGLTHAAERLGELLEAAVKSDAAGAPLPRPAARRRALRARGAAHQDLAAPLRAAPGADPGQLRLRLPALGREEPHRDPGHLRLDPRARHDADPGSARRRQDPPGHRPSGSRRSRTASRWPSTASTTCCTLMKQDAEIAAPAAAPQEVHQRGPARRRRGRLPADDAARRPASSSAWSATATGAARPSSPPTRPSRTGPRSSPATRPWPRPCSTACSTAATSSTSAAAATGCATSKGCSSETTPG